MTTETRLCAECGSDPWKSKDWDKLQESNLRIQSMYTREAGDWAVQHAILKLRIMTLEEAQKELQRKTQRQARVIRRLEDRLLKRSIKPYEPEPPAEPPLSTQEQILP